MTTTVTVGAGAACVFVAGHRSLYAVILGGLALLIPVAVGQFWVDADPPLHPRADSESRETERADDANTVKPLSKNPGAVHTMTNRLRQSSPRLWFSATGPGFDSPYRYHRFSRRHDTSTVRGHFGWPRAVDSSSGGTVLGRRRPAACRFRREAERADDSVAAEQSSLATNPPPADSVSAEAEPAGNPVAADGSGS